MKHLNDEQLGARLDGALTGPALEEADRHLASCATCRDALAALTAQDASLALALAHDPGEAYFAAFPARVEDRLRAEGLRGAQQRLREEGWLGWWRAPRRMAWAAAVATVVAGAAIVLVTSRDERLPVAGDRAIEQRLAQKEAVPGAPVESGEPGTALESHPAPPSGTHTPDRSDASRRATTQQAPGPEGPAAEPMAGGVMPAPARMREVRRDRATESGFARTPAVSPVPVPGGGVRVGRGNVAQPMTSAPTAQATAPTPEPAPREVTQREEAPMAAQQKSAADEERPAAGAEPPLARGFTATPTRLGTSDVALCGHVLDPQGRPVTRASVTLVSLGRTAHTGNQGDFCIDAPEGSYDLAVLAVGFEPTRMQVRVGGERSDVQVTLRAISVLDGTATAPDLRLSGGAAKTAPAKTAKASPAPAPAARDPFAGEAAAVVTRVNAALEATRTASRYPSQVSWEKAVALWNPLMGEVKTPAGRTETRYHVAEASVSLWRYNPTPAIKNQALMACMNVLAGTPTASQRKDAVQWMGEVRRGLGTRY